MRVASLSVVCVLWDKPSESCSLLSMMEKSVSFAGSETRSSFPMITQAWTVEKMDRKCIKFIVSKLFAIHKFLTAAKP